MTTFEDFLSEGWEQYPPNQHMGQNCDRCANKAVKRKNKKLFFINVEEYQLGKLKPHLKTQISCEANFYQEDGTWFKVSLHECEKKTIAEIRLFFLNVYDSINCIPDVHNND